MRKQMAVIGLGRFGESLAITLTTLGHDVLAIDIDEKKVHGIASKVTQAVQADATDEAFLREVGVRNIDMAIVAMGEPIESSVLTTLLLKKLGVPYVMAKAENELHGAILDKIGADKVIYPKNEMGVRVAHGITLRDVMDYIPLLQRYGVVKLKTPKYFIHKTLSELGFGRAGRWKMAVLLIKRENEIIVTPDSSESLQPDDVLILAGDDARLEEMLLEAMKGKSTK